MESSSGLCKEKAPEGAFSHVRRQAIQLSNNTSEPIADIQPDITSGFRQAGDAGALAVALVVLVEQVVDREVDVQVVGAEGLPVGVQVVDAVAAAANQFGRGG